MRANSCSCRGITVSQLDAPFSLACRISRQISCSSSHSILFPFSINNFSLFCLAELIRCLILQSSGRDSSCVTIKATRGAVKCKEFSKSFSAFYAKEGIPKPPSLVGKGYSSFSLLPMDSPIIHCNNSFLIISSTGFISSFTPGIVRRK